MAVVNEDDGRSNVSQAQQKNWGAPTDKSTGDAEATPQEVQVRSIGLKATPYEALINKVMSGKATAVEHDLYKTLVKEGRISPVGDGHSNPNTQASGGVDNSGNGEMNTNRSSASSSVTEEDDDGELMDKSSASEEEIREMLPYGFTKEEAQNIRSAYSDSEWPGTWTAMKTAFAVNPRLREWAKRNRLELSGVTKTNVSHSREARIGGSDVVKEGVGGNNPYGHFGMTGPFFEVENIQEHVDAIRGAKGKFAARSHVPFLMPPSISRGKGLGPRLEYFDELADWTMNKQRLVSEAIATTTSGAAMAIDGAIPALIVPTNLSAMTRDTVYFQQIQQGSNIARFQTITVPAAGALTQNTEPSQASQTLATVDITPTPRGTEQQISFEAERKILGPILEGIILSFRVSELYDEDFLLLGASQAFEAATIPTTGGLYNTGNQLFGNGRASEATVISTDTMALANLTDAQETMTAQGYAPNNLVVVMHPAQFRKLMTDSNVNRLVSFGPNTTPGQSWVAQGVIPELMGFEIRRSTLAVTGTGSAAITTYHAWAYIKGLTPAMAASRDLMIETFRDIRANSTWVKGHWDLKCGVLHPNSLVELDTA